ncbi:MAG: hypothetical protein JST30_08635 [Armatimonadetes bacterium]|nr:hypothetical protein [Armatimonadota bacterium]
MLFWPVAALSLQDPPKGVAGHAMVYSARLKAVVRVGGEEFGVTPLMKWTGHDWDTVEGSDLPARSLAAAACDTEGNLLVHGGANGSKEADGSSRFHVTGGTWWWNGEGWRKVASDGPAFRDHHAVAYDAARKVFVLYGGSDADPTGRTTLFGDTWEWADDHWTKAADAGPAPRAHCAMVYDPLRKLTLMVGAGPDSATWGWNGKSWRRLAEGAPADRTSVRMCWDTKAKRVLLFGGSKDWTFASDTWAWDGKAWKVVAKEGPPGRMVHGFAFDEARGVAVLFGGATRTDVLGDTWEFDGKRWKQTGG